MKILGIQTSTLIWSIGVVDGEKLLGEYAFNSYERLSKILVPAIDELLNKTGLKSKELDGIVVTKGPGLFTGGRIGLSVAKGLAMGLDIPVVGISTLEGLAVNLSNASCPVCPMLPARGEDVCAAIYKISSPGKSIRKIKEESVFNINEWLDKINEPTIFVGEGAIKYDNIIKKRLGKLALFAPLSSNYLRGSDIAFQATNRMARATKLSSLNLKAEYLRPAVEITKKKRK